MGGSVLMQFLFTSYSQGLAQAATAEAVKILGAIAATAQGAIMLYIILLGKRMVTDSLSLDEGVTKMVRAVIVVALLSAANFETFIATPITTTIPQWINGIVTGQQGLAGAQAWDALENQVNHFAAQIDTQAVGISYIAERILVGLIGLMCTATLVLCFFVWSLASATADLLVPIFAVVLPAYLFDATRGFAERTLYKIGSLFLVMLITLTLGQIVVYQDAQFLTKFATNVGAAPPAAGFNMLPDNDNIGIGPTTAGDAVGGTMNITSAIATFWDTLGVFLYGLFLLAIASSIALYIGGSSGFSTAPATRAIMVISRSLANAGRGRG
jgi:hypothetical protein